MDFQNRVGSKPGSGGVAGTSETNLDRRERLRRLALEKIDLANDPYLMKNHLGSYECKLCLTLHNNEGSYLAHTQGKKHQSNLARRTAKDVKETSMFGRCVPMMTPMPGTINGVNVPTSGINQNIKKVNIKIGRPGYKVTKIRDPETHQLGLLFQVHYPEISETTKPLYRFMSAFEQKVEEINKYFQYLLFAAEPYETIAFKIQSKEIDRGEDKFWTYWDPDLRNFHLQLFFKTDNKYTLSDNNRDMYNIINNGIKPY